MQIYNCLAILKNKPVNLRDSEREVINYNKALQYLKGIAVKSSASPALGLILDVHKIVLDGLVPGHRCGCLRKEPVFVNDLRLGKPIYLPPDHKDAGKLIDDLMLYIKQNQNKSDPLILAGIFHRQLVIIHPFTDGNGRTARLMTKCILASMGINTFNLFSFENYYNRNVTHYFQNVGVTGNYYEILEQIDFTRWLEYFTDGIIDELLRVSKELEAALNAMPDSRLKVYEKKVLEYISKNGFITDKDYSRFTERAKATRSLDFKRLIEKGLIERKGKGKATFYVNKENF
jgi:Fic family protein